MTYLELIAYILLTGFVLFIGFYFRESMCLCGGSKTYMIEKPSYSSNQERINKGDIPSHMIGV